MSRYEYFKYAQKLLKNERWSENNKEFSCVFERIVAESTTWRARPMETLDSVYEDFAEFVGLK